MARGDRSADATETECNHPLDVTVGLTADEGGYMASVRRGHVVLAPDDGSCDGTLRGELVTVVDSLAGRGPGLDAVLHGDRSALEPLSWMRSGLLPAS